MAVRTAEERAQRAKDTAALLSKINESTGTKNTSQTMQTDFFKSAGVDINIDSKTNKVSINGSSVKDYLKERDSVKPISIEKKKTDLQYKKDLKETEKFDAARYKKDQAQKAYEEYVASDEHKQRLEEEKIKRRQEEIMNPVKTNVNMNPLRDEKEEQLRAARDQAEAEYNASEDQEVIEHDLEAITGLSEEERRQLEAYAVGRVQDQNQTLELQGIAPTAQQEAAGLIQKYGRQRVDELAETYMRDENAALSEAVEATGRQLAQKSPVLASAATIPANLMGAIAGTVGQLQGAARRTGRYTTLDANETGTALEKFSGAVRDQVTQDIEGEDPGLLRKGASFLYQGGMNFLDSTARMLASGGSSGVSSAIAAMGSFSSALQKYSAMGASPEKAAQAAVVSAGLEYITEKLPTDQVLKLFHKGGKDSGVVKSILQQAFLTEPASEEVNLFAGIAAEALILGDQSGKNQRIGDLIANGASREEAEAQFWKETMGEALQTYAVSAVAGGLGAGGAVMAGNQVQAGQEQQSAPFAAGVQPAAVPAEAMQQPAAPQTEVEQLRQAMEATVAGLHENDPAQTWQEQLRQAQEALPGMQADHEPATKAVTNPIESYPPEKQNMIRSYLQSVDTKIKDFVQRVKGGDTTFRRQKIGDGSNRAAKDIGDLLGIDVKGYSHNINTNGVQHIINRHTGKSGGHDDTMSVDDDIARVGWVLENYDNVELLTENGEQVYSSEFSDSNNNPAPQIRFVKKIDGNYYVVEAAYENKYHKLWVQSAYLQKNNGDVTQAPAEGPSANHETNARSALASPSPDSSIADTGTEVNENSEYRDEFDSWGVDPSRESISDPLADRSYSEVGKRSVKAYMYENPAVKPFYQEQAAWLLSELSDTTKGERTYNEDVHYESGGEKGWSGTKRHTSDAIAQLLDEDGMSYEEIERGLNAIIQDNGQENNAVSKRIEFVINDRLMNGYTDFYTGEQVPGNADYLNLLKEQQTAVDDKLSATENRPLTEDRENLPMEGGQQAAPVGPDRRASNTYMNTGLHSENANIRAGYRQELRQDPDAAMYTVKHNADTLAEARSRTGSTEKNAATLDELMAKDHWTAEDVATSTLLLDEIMASGDADAISRLNDLRHKRKEMGTGAGQVSQAFSIHNETMQAADSPATAVDTFRKRLEGMKQGETTWSPKTGVDFETWKDNLGEEADRIGIAIACVEEGDSDSMRQIIRQIGQRRKTTAWFGTSQNLTGIAWNVLKKLEFEDLKKIANTQLVAMTDDFRTRKTGEVVGGLRKQSMLSSLKTFVRNISGNTVGGFADAVSESGAGRMADMVLSHFTGKKTVGNDLGRTAEYAKAAKEAGQFASLCVELNIPIETDVESSFAAAAGQGSNEKYMGRTFRATGNPAMRAMYAYQKYMSYALEVTDKIFEGGSNAAVTESLNRLKNANLTEQDVESLAEYTANKRTFKNATWEEDGETKGNAMARKGAEIKKAAGIVGEIAMPYVNVPMNVAQTGIDYTAGVAKGLGEMIGIIKDAKAGKTIPVERQRQAASDFGRGITGTAMIAMFASAAAMGALKVSNSRDWDKEALAQAEGRNGAQINWSALERGMKGESADWQTGDVISGLDFLEPFNTQMYLGAELAQAEDFNLLTYAGSTVKSVWQSLMDSPVMTGLADIEQTLNDISEAETIDDGLNVAAGYGGDVASSFIPQFVRQAAQDQDGYYRDTRGDTALESAINSLMAAIPGQSQKLPKKYSGLGEVQERGSAVETFMDPTATKVYEKNEVTGFLDELSGRTGDSSIYPSRQAPMRITVAGQEVALDGEKRETYQQTYGQNVNDLYRQLMENPDFETLSDELKTAALKEAEGYARKRAMAAVSDYREAPLGTAEQLTREIINREVKNQLSGLFTDLDTQREYGYSTEETYKKMEDSYQAFTELTPKTQKEILDQAVGDTARYLEVRAKGIKTEQFLAAAGNVDKAKGSGKNGNVRDIDKRQAIAGTAGMSSRDIDIIMKAYMSDYDPKDPDSEKTELKYDYIRQDLGLSPAAYAATYRAHLDNSKKAQKIAAIMALGYDRKTATTLYNIYAGNAKGKALYMP